MNNKALERKKELNGNNDILAKNTKAKIKANNKYHKENYVNITLAVRPEIREDIKHCAELAKMSTTAYIINCCRYVQNNSININNIGNSDVDG